MCKRARKGSCLLEFGPAILVVSILLMFPMVDLIWDAVSYCACVSLNDFQANEAARCPADDFLDENGWIRKAIPERWISSGMGTLAGLTQVPSTIVSRTSANATGDRYVNVETTFHARPLLQIPFFSEVPGLGKEFQFTISTRKFYEIP